MVRVCLWSAVALCLTTVTAQEPPSATARPETEDEWVSYDDAGVKVLVRYLKQEKDEMVLLMSLDTLARMEAKAKPAVPAIVETLKHPRWRIRLEAARTLIDVGAETEVAFRTLTEVLKDRDPTARARSALLIGEIVNPPFEWPSCWGPGPRPSTPRPALGKQAVPMLTESLKDDAKEVRSSAAVSLGRIGADAKAAVPALLNALEDKEATVRNAAAAAAQRIVVDAAAKAGVTEFQKAQREYEFK
jgi:HEAT repeat protein